MKQVLWNKKVIAVDISLILLAIIGAGFAVNFIYSNIINVHVNQYALAFNLNSTSPTQYDLLAMNATLTLDHNPVGSGYIIHFYQNDTEIGSTFTDSNGLATFLYNVTSIGDFQFKAGYEVP